VALSPELEPIKVNFKPGAKYADETRMFQGIPGLARSPSGRLWATWYGGGTKECEENYVMLVTSDDDGKTWSKVQLVLDPRPKMVRAFDPCIWLDPEGRLWLFWAQAIMYAKNPSVWTITTDQPDEACPQWSKPRRLFDGVMLNKPTVLKNGAWLFPTALWHTEGSCRVFKTTDQGRSFELLGRVNIPPRLRSSDEEIIIERNQDVWMLLRTREGISESLSTDGGKTWTDPVKSKIPHPVARFFIRRLDSGSLLLVKHGPMDQTTGRSQLMAFLSRDDGRSWEGGLMLDGRDKVSYPDGVQAPDGTIYIIYDFERYEDKRILMSTFTEEDVLAQRNVSGRVRYRVLINHATGMNPRQKKKLNRTSVPRKAKT
jgi:hypothetical protein